MEYATRILVIRSEQGLTQPELAAALDVSVRSIQSYEAGTTVPWRHFRKLEEIGKKPRGWMEDGDDDGDVTSHRWRGAAPLLLLLLSTGLASHFGDGDLSPHDEWLMVADHVIDALGGSRIGL